MLLKYFHEVYMFPYACMIIILLVNVKSFYSFKKKISFNPTLLCIDRD